MQRGDKRVCVNCQAHERKAKEKQEKQEKQEITQTTSVEDGKSFFSKDLRSSTESRKTIPELNSALLNSYPTITRPI